MSEEIVWEDPPEPAWRKRKGPSIWERRLTPLLERPGKWAKVTGAVSMSSSAATFLNHRILKVPRPEDRWEFTFRSIDGKGYIYARYLGPSKDGESA